ncbi:MAG: hypothetical protein R6U40_13865 [Desulfobacterales bacterium]
MKIIHYSEAEPKRFDADTVKGVTGRLVIGKSDGVNNFCMRFFELSDPCGVSRVVKILAQRGVALLAVHSSKFKITNTKKINVEHRTLNIERRMWMSLRSVFLINS